MNEDIYLTISRPTQETLFKDRNSKFFGYAFPVSSEEEVKDYLDQLKKQHPNAGHHCYAYQLGVENFRYRANDDGEPNHSAGMPIYGQIQSFQLTNVLVVSVRYFGGVKLGVGGLINAYKSSAKMSLEASEIVEEIKTIDFQLNFGYALMNKVMRTIKEKKLQIVSQKMELDCELVISVRRSQGDTIYEVFQNIFQVSIKRLET